MRNPEGPKSAGQLAQYAKFQRPMILIFGIYLDTNTAKAYGTRCRKCKEKAAQDRRVQLKGTVPAEDVK
jgi:hypothetical protein